MIPERPLLSRLFAASLAIALVAAFSFQAATAQGQTFSPAVLSDQRRWKTIGDVLRAVEPAYARQSDRRAANDAVAAQRLDRLLEWSGEAGVLLLVPLQEPISAAHSPVVPASRLGTPVLIGVGAHPFDAAAAALSPGPLLAEPNEGMRFALSRSQFVWAGKEGKRLRFRHLTVAEGLALRAAVTRFRANDVESAIQRRGRIARIVNGVAARFQRQPGAAPLAGSVENARAAYDGARTALSTGERNRRDWRTWARKSAEALEIAEKYLSILTMPELRAQARALVIPALRDEIRRADTPAALQQILRAHRDERTRRSAEIDVAGLCRAELEAYRSFVASMALPDDQARLIDRLLPPRGDGDCATI